MSAIVPCGECNGSGERNGGTCQWCEGTGRVEVPDGFRPRRTRSKTDLRRIAQGKDAADEEHAADALVLRMPPARGTITRGD